MTHPAMAATLPSEAEAVLAKETSRLLASRVQKVLRCSFGFSITIRRAAR